MNPGCYHANDTTGLKWEENKALLNLLTFTRIVVTLLYIYICIMAVCII